MTAAVSIARQREKFNKTVRVCMARKGIRNDRELAGRLGIGETLVYRRMEGRTQWTLPEIWRLVRVLEPSGDELASVLVRRILQRIHIELLSDNGGQFFFI